MARYRTTVDSTAPAADVFDYLADFASVALWDPGVRSAELISGTPGTSGAWYRVVAGFLGRAIPLDYEILAAEPPTGQYAGRVELEAHTADFRSHDVISVQPTGTGCRVTYDADLALKGLRRPFDPVLRIAFTVIGERAKRGLAAAVLLQRAA